MAERALDESRQYRQQAINKVAAANQDLGKRMRTEGMEIEYLADEDRLYVTIGAARPSEAIPINDGTHSVFLVDPISYEITGFEAPYFREDLRSLSETPEFFQLILELIGNGHEYVYVPPAKEAERTERAMAALIPTS